MIPAVEAFVEYARRYSIAVRRSNNMAASGNRDQIDDAISVKQTIESEVAEHFQLVKTPEFMRARR